MGGSRALGLGVFTSLVLMAACGGDDAVELPGEPFVEVPIGDPATATIGAEGGSITSTDGRLTLEFPPGAVTDDLEVVVQEIEWEDGRAWSLGPDGTEFEVPVIARLTLTADEAGGVTTTVEDGNETTSAPMLDIVHFSISNPSPEEALAVEAAWSETHDSVEYLAELPHFSVFGYGFIPGQYSTSTEAWVGGSVFYGAAAPDAPQAISELFDCGRFGGIRRIQVMERWTVTSLEVDESSLNPAILGVVGIATPIDLEGLTGLHQELRCIDLPGDDTFHVSVGLTIETLDLASECERLEQPPYGGAYPARVTCKADLSAYAMLYDYGVTISSGVRIEVDPVGETQVFTGDSAAGAEILVVDLNAPAMAPSAAGGQPAAPLHVTIAGINPSHSVPVSDGVIVSDDGGRIVKLDAAGAIVWQNRIGTLGYEYLAITPSGGILAARGGNFNGSVYVAELSADGVALSETSFTAGNYPTALMAHSGGGYVIMAVGTNLLRVDGTGTILWQKQFSGFGSASVAETSDGGIIEWDGSSRVRRIAADGALVWQKDYAGISISSISPTATGLLAFGSVSGVAAVVVLGADGAVVSAKTYRDTEMAGPGGGGGALLADGRMVLGAGSTAGQFTSIVIAADMTVPGCGDPGFGVDVAPGTITSVDGTATYTDTAFIRAFPSFTTSAPTLTATAGTVTTTSLCDN